MGKMKYSIGAGADHISIGNCETRDARSQT